MPPVLTNLVFTVKLNIFIYYFSLSTSLYIPSFTSLGRKQNNGLGENKQTNQTKTKKTPHTTRTWVRASACVNWYQLHFITAKDHIPGLIDYVLETKEQFTFVRLSCESYRSKLIQEVSSRVRKQRTVKQRVFPSERVWIQVSIQRPQGSIKQDTNTVKLIFSHSCSRPLSVQTELWCKTSTKATIFCDEKHFLPLCSESKGIPNTFRNI